MAEPGQLVRVATILTMYVFLFHGTSSALPATPADTLCIPHERDALLDFKAGLTNPSIYLSSWRGVECCGWSGVICSNRTGHVITLQIESGPNRAIGGEVRSSLLTLRHLKRLDLKGTNFGRKPIPELIGALGYLTHLDLSYSNFGGRIPPHLGNLTNLVNLQLNGMIHAYSHDLAWVSRLGKLQVLGMSEVDLGRAVDWTHAINMLPCLIDLDLSSCGLKNSLPPPMHSNLTSLETLTTNAVGNLTSIQKMNLDGNKLTGMVPLNLKKMKKLQELMLYDNFINMDVQELLRRLPSDELLGLGLGYNYLTGSLPTWLGRFSSLTMIGLENNGLSGEIPVGISELKNLYQLWLNSNNLHGTITEDHFRNLTTLERLDISDNSLTVKVGSTWKPPFSLYEANFRSCILGPQFPSWLDQPTITDLDVSNTSIHDNIPIWIANSHAYYLGLSRNRLVGRLPTFPLSSPLEILDVSNNLIVGPIPVLPNNLYHLDLSGNNLSGTLPSNIGAPMLEVILLFHNSFYGTIPCSLLQLPKLLFLDISKNLLNGTFPNCPRGLKTSNITMLDLNSNSLSGAFPLFLQICKELKFLDLAYNKFSGSLPTWIVSKLPQLGLLRLRSNMFSGDIPSQLTDMKGLQFLDIACNNISGHIPQSLGNLIRMSMTPNNSGGLFDIVNFGTGDLVPTAGYEEVVTFVSAYADSLFMDIKGQELEYTKGIAYMVNIDLSCNSLTGQIPQEIGMLIALKNLNFSWNSLTGIIPQSLGELQALESFDLSHNELSGEIPTSLSNLTSLSRLNLSYNNLTGTIPFGNQLRTLEDQASIYVGNSGLCGPPLPRSCSRADIIPYAPERHDEGMNDVVSLYASMCIGFVVGLWVVFCGFLFKRKWRGGWFSFTDHMYDRAYVQVAVGWAALARQIRQG